MDILLYAPDGTRAAHSDGSAEGTRHASIGGRTASRTETIGNKVVKFLLTPIGSDALNSNYGAYLPTNTQISISGIPRLRIEIMDDIARCISYIKKSEEGLDDEIEKLETITLAGIEYAPRNIRGLLVVRIEAKTTHGNNAMVNIPVG